MVWTSNAQTVGLYVSPRLMGSQGVKFEIRKFFSGEAHGMWSIGSASRIVGRQKVMARSIPLSKRLEVVKLYLEGLPYNGIAKKTGIVKGGVAAIVEALRAGEFPQVKHVTDLVNELRDLTVGFRKAG